MAEFAPIGSVGWLLILLAAAYLGYQWLRGMSHERPR